MKSMLMVIWLCSTLNCIAITAPINFETALKKKLIKAEIRSKGGHQGYCVNIRMQNNTHEPVSIIVSAGTKFNSLDDANQDLIIVKNSTIHLRKMESKNLAVKAYCCQASKRSPAIGSKYQIVKADTNLRNIAVYLSKHNFSQ